MNITDISQKQSIDLICRYWATQKVSNVIPKIIFVGDCHGDLHQFIAPLVLNGIIKLSGALKIINEDIDFYVPDYEINKQSLKGCRLIYLGDVVNEWIHSRTILWMLHDLLVVNDLVSDGVNGGIEFILGNHDLSILGRYYLYKQNTLNIPEDIPVLWITLRKELNNNSKVKIYNQTIEYENSATQGKEYLYKYIAPLFECMFEIFKNKKSKLCSTVKLGDEMFMVSHSTWTSRAIKELFGDVSASKNVRPGDLDKTQLLPLIDSPPVNVSKLDLTDYKKLSDLCNEMFYSKNRLYITKNLITYSRNVESVFLNHVVGHVIGDEWRDIKVNEGNSKYNNERKKKLTPMNINNKKIYYLDFGASAGYDHDEISRPDYVMFDNSLQVTDLPAFTFIIENMKHAMMVMKHKTPHSNDKFTFTYRKR